MLVFWNVLVEEFGGWFNIVESWGVFCGDWLEIEEMYGIVCVLFRVEGSGNLFFIVFYLGNKSSLKLGVKKNIFIYMEIFIFIYLVEGSFLIYVNVFIKMR